MKGVMMKKCWVMWGFLWLCSCVKAAEVVTVQAKQEDANCWVLTVGLEGEGELAYCGFQMDVALPEGLSYQDGSIRESSRIEGFTLLTVPHPAGVLRIVGYSSSRQSIQGTEGPLFTFTLCSDTDMEKEPVAVLKNIRFSDAVGTETVLARQIVELLTALISPLAREASHPIYTLQGMKMDKTTLRGMYAGLYIVGGRKIIVK